jgi:uncharacterized protein YgbK (DUF1537 family)
MALSRRNEPAVCAPDIELADDLRIVSDGLRRAEWAGARVVVRCGPAFAGVLTDTVAHESAELPRASESILIVCGSYVPTTSRQLARLLEAYPGVGLEAQVRLLASTAPEEEIARLAAAADRLLAARGLAVISTPRERPPATQSLETGEQIAVGLARVVAALTRRPGVVLAKGGITSAVTARMGLKASRAWVRGPVAPGVALWEIADGKQQALPYIVVPGNVGADDLLEALVTRMVGR